MAKYRGTTTRFAAFRAVVGKGSERKLVPPGLDMVRAWTLAGAPEPRYGVKPFLSYNRSKLAVS